MQLKKPKVKVKQSAKPKPTQRIVTKMKSASMPDIQLPELSGVSDGLNTGIGGFDLMPNLNETTLLVAVKLSEMIFPEHFMILKEIE